MVKSTLIATAHNECILLCKFCWYEKIIRSLSRFAAHCCWFFQTPEFVEWLLNVWWRDNYQSLISPDTPPSLMPNLSELKLHIQTNYVPNIVNWCVILVFSYWWHFWHLHGFLLCGRTEASKGEGGEILLSELASLEFHAWLQKSCRNKKNTFQLCPVGIN